MTDSLAHKSSRGVLVTLGGFLSRSIVQFGSVIILSRLLAPEDFGLLAMIMAIVGVVDLIRDFGLTGAILQRKDVSEHDWSGLMWLSTGVGLLLTLVVGACAPLIASLYNEPRLTVLTLVVSPTLLINGLLSPVHARIQRDLRFTTLASIEALSTLCGVVLAIIAAFLGWGVWSLIVQAGAAQLYRMIALWVAAPPKFGRPQVSREVLRMVRVGGDLLGMQILNYASRNADNVLIGNQLGPAALGQYTRAYSLFMLPMQQLNATLGRVAAPVLSQLQDDHERYRQYIRAASRVIGYVTVPIYAIIASVAGPLISVVLGDGWEQAGVLLSILSIAGVAQAMGNMQGWLFLTLGRTRIQFILFGVTRPVIIGGFAFGLWWGGVNGLALVYGLLSLILLIPGYHYAIKGTHVTWSDILLPMLRPSLVAPICSAVSWIVVGTVAPWGALAQLLLGGVCGLLPLLASIVVPAYRRDLRAILDYLKKARKQPRKADSSSPEANK